MPDHVLIEFYHVLGGFITRYGFIDALIADMCRIITEDLGGHRSHKEPPQNMSRRRDLIEVYYRDDPGLAGDCEAITDICHTVKAIDYIRHFIVHGCQTEFFPEDQTYQFTKVDRRKDKTGYEQTSIKVTQSQLSDLTHSCEQTVRHLTPIGARLEEYATVRKGQQ